MKIQITETKSVEWTPPWAKSAETREVVGIELGAGLAAGCPAVRVQKRKDGLAVTMVGFIDEPGGALPTSWDDLSRQSKWSVPAAFRADCAALAVNSRDSLTRQTARDSEEAEAKEGLATSRNGVRSVYRRMADELSVLEASLPEYQALWLNRLLPEGRRPTAASVQTAASALLASLAVQPGFCEAGDEMAVFVTQTSIYMAGFRRGVPLLFRECPGSVGVAAMRAAVKMSLGLDETMLEAVFASGGIIDTRPALEPLLSPVVSQLELTLDYLRNRLGADARRLYLMGDATGCAALRRAFGERLSIPVVTPNPFDGLILPAKSTAWKDRYCVGEAPQAFLAAIGAALAVLEGAT